VIGFTTDTTTIQTCLAAAEVATRVAEAGGMTAKIDTTTASVIGK
jgi:hypothetical protein